MKKSSLFNLLISAVIVLSYFNINQNVICGKLNAETNTCSGNYIEIKSGDFASVQWDGDYRYSQIVSMNNSAIDITTIFCGNLCYTYINAYKLDYDSVTELRAYIDTDEYISLFVHVIPQDFSGGPATITEKTTHTTTTYACTSQTTACAPSETLTQTTTRPSAAVTTISDVKPTSKDTVIITTKYISVSHPEKTTTFTTSTFKSSLSSVVETSVADSEDISFTKPGTSNSNGAEDRFYYGSVMSANEYGDVNSDGKVDISDLTRLSLALLGDTKLTAAERFAADVIPSPYSIPDLADMVTLKQFIMKENVTFGPKHIVYR